MPLQMHALCSYYTDHAHREVPRNRDQWDATMLCLAVKRRELRGYINAKFSGNLLRVSGANIGQARKFFGSFIKYKAHELGLDDCFFVPVPSKDSFHTGGHRSFLMLVEALGLELNHRILNCLRFTQPLQPAHEGGPRGFHNLYPHMQCTMNMHGKRVILVDDLATGGGTLRVAKARIEEAGGEVVCGIVCGRTDDNAQNPLQTVSWTLEW